MMVERLLILLRNEELLQHIPLRWVQQLSRLHQILRSSLMHLRMPSSSAASIDIRYAWRVSLTAHFSRF